MNAKSRKRIGTALLVLSLVLVAAANLHVGYAMTVGGGDARGGVFAGDGEAGGARGGARGG